MTVKITIGLQSKLASAAIARLAAGTLLALAITHGGFASDATAADQTQKTVLELFTSQGCSSCPPADALLTELAERDDILALSFPVSYWDYLGWKDTLAKDEYNERQYKYAANRGDREIYTPQLIVNGLQHVVGSRPDAVASAIEETTKKLQGQRVPLTVEIADGKANILAGSAAGAQDAPKGRLWLVCYLKNTKVAISRGENTGRKIAYTNVAREMIPIGDWNGKDIQYTVDLPDGGNFDGVAILLQDTESLAIIGATSAPVPGA